MSVRIPRRVQMSRQHPWRADNPDAIIVAGHHAWSNPYRVERWNMARGEKQLWWVPWLGVADYTPEPQLFAHRTDAARLASQMFAARILGSIPYLPAAMVPLSGHDLACWCPIWDRETPCPVCHGDGAYLDRAEADSGHWCEACDGSGCARWPCHADVLLRLANPDVQFPWAEATR